MIALGAVLLGDVPWSHRVLLAGAWLFPIPFAFAVGVLVFRNWKRNEEPPMGREAEALLGVVAALESGYPLRSALEGLSPAAARQVEVGAPTERLAVAVRQSLGEYGAAAASAVRLLDRAGGPAAAVFAQLAARAAETMRVRREVRAAVAAPILQGIVVGGMPLLALVHMVVTGRFARTFSASTAHAVSVSVGALLTVLGVCWVAWVVRKAFP